MPIISMLDAKLLSVVVRKILIALYPNSRHNQVIGPTLVKQILNAGDDGVIGIKVCLTMEVSRVLQEVAPNSRRH